MKPLTNAVQKNISVVAAALLLVLTLLLPALARSAPSAVHANRFLFIIDTSAAMKPLETPLRETVFDLIYSGARGHMTNGDTFGVWLVNDRNDSSFPMESWQQKQSSGMAGQATAHVDSHGLKGKARFELAFTDVRQVIKNVEDLTVILVSNGETPVAGTPFDEAINARFRELAPEMKRAKATLNTTLVAQGGEFVAWAVNSPDFLIEVPGVAPKPRPLKVEAVAVKAPAPASVAAVAPSPAPVVAEKSRVVPPSIFITKDTVAQERRANLAAMTTAVEPVPTVVTNVISSPAPGLSPVTNSVAVAPTSTVKEPVHPVAAPATNPSPVIAVVVPVKVETTNVMAATVATPPPVAPTVELPKTAPASRSLLWAITGGSVTLAVVFGVLLLRRRPEPSLISQALARERLNVS